MATHISAAPLPITSFPRFRLSHASSSAFSHHKARWPFSMLHVSPFHSSHTSSLRSLELSNTSSCIVFDLTSYHGIISQEDSLLVSPYVKSSSMYQHVTTSLSAYLFSKLLLTPIVSAVATLNVVLQSCTFRQIKLSHTSAAHKVLPQQRHFSELGVRLFRGLSL